MSWIGLVFLVPFGLFVAAVWTGLAMLQHRRDPSFVPYLFRGMRFFDPLWFKPEARPLQRRFTMLFAFFLLSIIVAAALGIVVGATGR